MSLVWLFERGFRIDLTLYLAGVVAAIVPTALARRPVLFQGIIPAAFPLWIATIVTASSIQNSYPGYLQVLTPGVFLALIGSVLLEGSYFSYRKNATIRSKVVAMATKDMAEFNP